MPNEQEFVLVPRVPTEEMYGAGTAARWISAIRDANNVREIYQAMLAAAPPPPQDVRAQTTALAFALDTHLTVSEARDFLIAWRAGEGTSWPGYSDYLRALGSPAEDVAAPAEDVAALRAELSKVAAERDALRADHERVVLRASSEAGDADYARQIAEAALAEANMVIADLGHDRNLFASENYRLTAELDRLAEAAREYRKAERAYSLMDENADEFDAACRVAGKAADRIDEVLAALSLPEEAG